MRLTLPKIVIGRRVVSQNISIFIFLILGLGVFLVPLIYHDAASRRFPDEQTLLAAYKNAETCSPLALPGKNQSSYSCSAYLLKKIGVDAYNGPILGALLSVILTLAPLFTFSRISIFDLTVNIGWGFVRAIFLSVLSKDVIAAGAVALVMLAIPLGLSTQTWAAASFLYGWVVRKYWLLTLVIWAAFTRVAGRVIAILGKGTAFRLVFAIFGIYLVAALLFNLILHVPLEFARSALNEDRIIGEKNSLTVIAPWIISGNLGLQATNATLVFLRLCFPFELLRFHNLGQLLFITVMVPTSRMLYKTFRSLTSRRNKNRYFRTAWFLLLIPIAFLFVEGIFEPDFGSFARHFSMMSPLAFCALGLSIRGFAYENEDTENLKK